jgi:hypothetical protein
MGAIADAIVGYAQPLIDQTDGSLEQMQKALSISQACWNLALLPADKRQSAIDDLQDIFQVDDAEFADFQHSVLLPMIRRHEEMFPALHGRQSLDPPHWQASLPAAPKRTLLVPTLTHSQEKAAGPSRYDPFPCNSGKKYKFCCGRGRG